MVFFIEPMRLKQVVIIDTFISGCLMFFRVDTKGTKLSLEFLKAKEKKLIFRFCICAVSGQRRWQSA